MARALLEMATDENTPEHVKLKAITEALDRAGVGTRQSVEVEVSAKPIDQVLDGITNSLEITTRADWRRANGIPDDDNAPPPALAELLAGDPKEPIDAEVFDVSGHAYPMTPTSDERPPWMHTDAATADYDVSIDYAARLVGRQPPVDTDQAMTIEDANETVAQMRHSAAQRARDDSHADGHAVVHPAQRALPPGRSDR